MSIKNLMVDRTYLYENLKYVVVFIDYKRNKVHVEDAESGKYDFAFPIERFMRDAQELHHATGLRLRVND